ncbi:FkbM family methyltransferase [Massilia atriviolacea]|uniref:FkbM family methyltransferase n=1 Tax=Massilia atriviolacea TaxID=2495579 RepID=A0A430HJ21_9BURK|nr:FkbM family methyltransferase [Massilia atriviolacea]RSZ57517.1 FkbM family methyltransferase [Massilia atriviolacea]
MDTKKLMASLGKIAARPAWREAFIEQLLHFERAIATAGIDVREDVIGPLVDALYDDDQIVRKELADGTRLDFLYRSKIARDFLLSAPARPDHAWEPQTSRLLVELAAKARQILVGGAYFGDQAILLARQAARNKGWVHAFEPNSEQRRMLVHNAALNGLDNIVARPEGLWDDSATTLKLVGYDSFAHPEVSDDDSGFRTTTMKDYLDGAGIDRLDLIMLDIEGAELRALRGAAAYLALPAGQAPDIVFEVHRDYVDWSDGLENTAIVRFLQEHGYAVFAVRDFNSNVDMEGKPIELIPAASVYLEGPPHGFNMVAVKDASRFAHLPFKICHHVSPKLLRHKDPALHHPTDGL